VNRRPVIRNAGMTIMQVVVSSVILFFLYRYLLDTLGVAKLGVWSVVMATASASRMSELGISGSVVKFVAKYRAHSDVLSVSEVVQTAAISTAVLLSVMLGLLYPIFSWLLKFLIPASDIAEGLAILPYTLISLWCIALAGVFLSGLEGCQRIDLRSWILMGSSIIYLFLTVILVPEFGLIGLAFGQVLQAGIVLTISWILLRHELKILPSIPSRWSKRLFKEMIGYGANFQIVSIVGMMFEPVTKGLLSRYGGLAMVGYYEMASRMVLQFRIIIVSANQVLVPVIAALQETAPDRIRIIYRESYRLIVYLSLPLFSGLVAANPVISELWIGAYENTFVLFAMVLTVAWLLNILISPAYFANLGTGHLFWNTVGHVVIGVLNLTLGAVLGVFYGGIGVVCGWAAALVVGSGFILLSYHARYGIPLGDLLPEESRSLCLACGIGAAIALLFYYRQWFSPLGSASGVMIYAFIVLPFCWFHPMKGRLVLWLKTSH
jgi:O-antigen/teichoic acid export membrane protein